MNWLKERWYAGWVWDFLGAVIVVQALLYLTGITQRSGTAMGKSKLAEYCTELAGCIGGKLEAIREDVCHISGTRVGDLVLNSEQTRWMSNGCILAKPKGDL